MSDEYTWLSLIEECVYGDCSGISFTNHTKSYTKFFFRATSKESLSQSALVKEISASGYLERILCKALSEGFLELLITLFLSG